MAQFLYEAKKSPKDVIKGVLAADSKAAAIQKIGKMGYYIISLKEDIEQFIDRLREIYTPLLHPKKRYGGRDCEDGGSSEDLRKVLCCQDPLPK